MPAEPFKSRLLIVWLTLMAVTLISWALGHGRVTADTAYAGVSVIALACLKVRWVVLDFMELRHSRPAVRWAAEAWLVLIGVTWGMLYLWRP